MLINVDFDGTLVPNTMEKTLLVRKEQEGWSWDWSSQLYDWYEKFVDTHSLLPLDVNLLTKLTRLKDMGHSIRLWTNRNYTLRSTTFKNLGVWKRLFDSFSFNDGLKSQTSIEGIVIDNDPRYFPCAEKGGILHQFGRLNMLLSDYEKDICNKGCEIRNKVEHMMDMVSTASMETESLHIINKRFDLILGVLESPAVKRSKFTKEVI